MVADGKVFVGSRGKDFWILKEGKTLTVLDSIMVDSPIHSTPVAANQPLFLSTMNKLYAIKLE